MLKPKLHLCGDFSTLERAVRELPARARVQNFCFVMAALSMFTPSLSGARPTFGLTLCATLAALTLAQAAPVPNLTFNINAKVAATGASGAPTQKFDARVLLHGNRTRIESKLGGQDTVTLIAPPYIYRLLPASKAGVRWKMDARRAGGFAGLGVDPQQLIRNPASIRALLTKVGAKRTGAGQVGGAAVEIYQISAPKGPFSSAKAWLRKSDALPLRLDASGQGLQISALWSNYARPKDLPAALFQAPKGYRIRDAKSAPPMSMF